MIKIENVSKFYKVKRGGVQALSDINLNLPSKGFVALTGENGCGKTTLLNIISTIDKKFKGNVIIDGLDVRKNKDLIRAKIISYVFQDKYFIDNLNVKENLLLENSNENELDQKLENYGIFNKKENKTIELSGGQRQRVSMVRGLIKDFDILLVDEPTSSMDEEMERYVFNELKEISKDKLVVLVSHNLSLIYDYCNMIIKLNNGNIEYVKYNSSISEITYKDNEITFLNSLNFNSIDKDKAESIINEYGELKIKKNSEPSKSFEPDYAIKEYSKNDISKKDKYQLGLLFKSCFFASFNMMILFSLIISMVLIGVEASIDLMNFDVIQFTYNSLIENNESLTNISEGGAAESEENFFTIEDVNHFFNSDTRFDLVSTLDGGVMKLEFEWDQIHENHIHSINKTNFKNCNLVYGSFPIDYASFVLTDYLADSLILKNEDYSSYEDIINKGIFIDNYCIHICGILDTNYEYYQTIDDKKIRDREGNNENLYKNVAFQSLYMLGDSVASSKTGLRYSPEYFAFFDCEIDSSVKDDHCYINKAFAKIIHYYGQDDFEFKSKDGYYTVDKVVDDENSNPTIYVNNKKYQSINDLEYFPANSYNIEINNIEIIRYLNNKCIVYNTYSGRHMTEIATNIDNLSGLFLIISILVFIIVLVLIIFMVSKKANTNRKLYVFSSMYGFNNIKYILFEMIAIFIFIVTSLTINSIIYPLVYKIMNTYLFNAFGVSISIFIWNFKTYIIVSLILIFIFAIVYILKSINRNNKNIIEYIK